MNAPQQPDYFLHPTGSALDEQVWREWKPKTRSRQPVSAEVELELRLRDGSHIWKAAYEPAIWTTISGAPEREIVAYRVCSKAEHLRSEQKRNAVKASAKALVDQIREDISLKDRLSTHAAPGSIFGRFGGPDGITNSGAAARTATEPVKDSSTERWLAYTGGARPVAGNVLVEVRRRNGEVQKGEAGHFSWADPCYTGSDIVAWRTYKLPAEKLTDKPQPFNPLKLSDLLSLVMGTERMAHDYALSALKPGPDGRATLDRRMPASLSGLVGAEQRSNPKDQAADRKLPLWLCSPIAKAHWAVAQYAGLAKYGAWNWRDAGVRSSVYLSAMQRHMDAYVSGEEFDPVDGSHHLGNIMACCAILLDAKAAGKLTDDRPPSVSVRPTYEWAEGQIGKLKAQYAHLAPRHFTIADTQGPAK